MLHTIVDERDIFPYDYQALRSVRRAIPYGWMEQTRLPEGQWVSRVVSTDLKQYLPPQFKLTE